jgi:hypothetical protein
VPGYADGAYTTLLTLDFFSDHRLSTIRTTPVLSFKAKSGKGKELEADFGLFWSESIYGHQEDGLARISHNHPGPRSEWRFLVNLKKL